MDSKIQLKLALPTFTSEESMVATKLNVGCELTEEDYMVIRDDALRYIKAGKDKNKLLSYIKIKYPKLQKDIIDKYILNI